MTAKPQLSEVPKRPEEEGAQKGRRRSVLGELSKRKVCRTAISYILVMWLNLQIGDVIFPMVGLPEWSLHLIIIIGVMGFPVVLLLSWAFQITPEGIVLDSGDAAGPDGPDRQLDTIVNVLLLLASIVLSVLLLLHFFAEGRSAPGAAWDNGEAVITSLSIAPASEAAEGLVAGVQQELRHRLILLDGIRVLPETATRDADAGRPLSLAGSLLVEGNTAHVLAHLIDLSAGRYVMSVAFNLEMGSRLAVETAAADRIMEALKAALAAEDVA